MAGVCAMSRLIITATVFIAGVFAMRLRFAKIDAEDKSHKVVQASDFNPVQLLPRVPPAPILGPPAVVPSGQFGETSQFPSRISARGPSYRRPPWMSMPDQDPDLPFIPLDSLALNDIPDFPDLPNDADQPPPLLPDQPLLTDRLQKKAKYGLRKPLRTDRRPLPERPSLASISQAEVNALLAERIQLLKQLKTVESDKMGKKRERKKREAALGSRTNVFEPAFGYLSQSAGVYTEAKSLNGSNLPSNVVDLATKNFGRELPNLLKLLSGSQKADDPASKEAADLRAKLDMLVLDNDKVWAREKNRPEVEAPLVLLGPYYVLCFALDVAFEGRPLARFWFLETVARMPYFAYMSALHLYETLGWWRRSAETKRVHFAEEWNEFHHLLTMEALGGDQLWQDRFLGQHAAIAYFWVLIGQWFLSPSLAYKFSELIEAHAVDTYGEFVDANRDILAELPAPRVTRQYYNGEDLYMFDEFQTSRPRGSRRPVCETLLDVFENIRDDEAEHVATMVACQDPTNLKTAAKAEKVLVGSALVGAFVFGLAGGSGVGEIDLVADAISSATEAGVALDAARGAADLAGSGAADVAGALLPEQLAGLSAVAVKALAETLEAGQVGSNLGELFEGLERRNMMEDGLAGLLDLLRKLGLS